MSLSDALCKDTWVLGVEEQIDAEKLNKLRSTVPVTRVLLTGAIVAVDENWPPDTHAIWLYVKTLARDRAEGAVWLFAI